MRFLLAVIDTQSGTATGDEMAAIDKFNQGLQDNGHWIMAFGIESPKNSTLIDNRDNAGLVEKNTIFNDEYVSGAWIIEAESRGQAEALAKAGSLACNRKVEVRAFL